jgi:hypothetical protein
MPGADIAFIFGPLIVLVLLLCGWSVYRLLGMWLVDRTLSGFELMMIVGVMLVLIALSFSMQGLAAVGPIILLALVVGAIPLLPIASEAIRGRRLLRADILNLKAALKRQPDVPYPHLRLGQIYEEQEDWERAIEHYRAYVEMHELSAQAKRRLERCLARKRREEMGLRVCAVCGAENQPGRARCIECGFYLKGAVEILDTLVTPEMMRLWRWLIVVFLVPGLIVGLLADIISPVVSVVMLSVSVIATMIFLYGRMRSEGGPVR